MIGISPDIYSEAEFEKYEELQIYASGNLVEGTLSDNSKIILSELLTEIPCSACNYESGDGMMTFEGLFAKMEMPKSINTCLYLRKKTKIKSIKELRNISSDEIELEYGLPEFKEIFDVYASNEVYTKQLLTTEVMQELIECYNQISYEITVKENCLYIRLWCDNLFEIPGVKSFSLKKDALYKRYKKLENVFSVIDKILKIF